MARKTKAQKQAEEAKLNVGAEIFASLRDLEKLKGIPVDYMVERLKQGLTNAYNKDKDGKSKDGPHENVVVDLSEQGLTMHVVKTAVEEVEDPISQIHIDAARNLDPNAQVGAPVCIPIDISKFGRQAAGIAKQVVIQGIREAERSNNAEQFSSKAQELVTGTVHKVDPNGDLILLIPNGSDTLSVILRAEEQIPGEQFAPGDLVKVYLLEPRKTERGPLVRASRTHPNLVRRLFELETPEIADGHVEIRNIARDPGSRSKMAVRALTEGVDPVGACIGPRGGRVGAVVSELHGEKIDIVVYSEDPCEYVKAALSPATVLSVEAPAPKICRVVVPDDQLSLAIGKEGQNARLAARLTGCKIDIKPASQAEAQE